MCFLVRNRIGCVNSENEYKSKREVNLFDREEPYGGRRSESRAMILKESSKGLAARSEICDGHHEEYSTRHPIQLYLEEIFYYEAYLNSSSN